MPFGFPQASLVLIFQSTGKKNSECLETMQTNLSASKVLLKGIITTEYHFGLSLSIRGAKKSGENCSSIYCMIGGMCFPSVTKEEDG